MTATSRRCSWVCKPPDLQADDGLFQIVTADLRGKEDVRYYFVRTEPSEIGGRGFRVIRLDRKGKAKRYYVLLVGDPKLDHCECGDSLYRGHKRQCRHILALRRLYG